MHCRIIISVLITTLIIFQHNLSHAADKKINAQDSQTILNDSSDPQIESESPIKEGFFNVFKNKSLDFFPVPVFETNPEKGESYGVLPIFLLSDKETKAITVIMGALGYWNSIIKFSGAAIVYIYPNPSSNPDEVLELFFEMAQRYYRETSIRYFNPKLNDIFYLDTKFRWLKTPYSRFFGFGAGSTESGESNYVSRNFLFDTTFGYYIIPNLRINLTETFTTTDLLTRAITRVSDTLTRYGGLPGVNDATNLIHKLSITYDTRPNLTYSKRGTFVEGSYFFSIKDFISDNTINGFSVEAIQLIPLFNERTVTSLRLFAQDMYGTGIPFYLQSNLGGATELRAFIRNRFTDTGKIVFTWEQRIKIIAMKILDIPVEFHADPFFELGRVFHHINNFSFKNLQPVGGLGIRAIVPPNIVARLDFAVGREGFEVYTLLGYPF